MKKLFQKIGALLLTAAMVLAMSLPVLAAEITDGTGGDETPAESKYNITNITTFPAAGDKVNVTISGLDGDETVTLYQIASAAYENDKQKGYVELQYVKGITTIGDNPNLTPTRPTDAQITNIVQNIGTGEKQIHAGVVVSDAAVEGTEFSQEVSAGVYIAVITGNGSVYNPVYLTATYGKNESDVFGLLGGKINLSGADNTYLFGLEAIVKKSTPKIAKKVTGKKDDSVVPSIETASVGDVVNYELNPTFPVYQKDAKNKTLYIQDKFTKGITFLFDSLQIKLTNGDGSVNVSRTESLNGEYIYKVGEKVFAVAKEINTDENEDTDEFRIVFTYDNLISNSDTGALYGVTVTYKGVLNEAAVVGTPGNPNTVTLKYSTTPTSGSTWDGTDNEPQEGLGQDSDKAIVYTYQLAFKKVGEGDKSEALADAIFGIYGDKDCTKLIDVVKTNDKGIAVSNQVGCGTYYIQEIQAPEGYSLNTKVYHMNASWATATYKQTKETIEYTTDIQEAGGEGAEPVGYLVGGIFYKEDPTSDKTAARAYIKDRTHTSSISTITNKLGENGTAGQVADLIGDDDKPAPNIPNTKLTALPSTGGMGTYLFTLVGVAVMAIMAFLFFKGRRSEEE